VASYVCLLRGVNVGGKRPVAMADLRDLFGSLGFQDVRTYIQSGNVVFSAASAPRRADIEPAIERAFGLRTAALLRSAADLRRVVGASPFDGHDPARVHVGFLPRRPPAASVRALDDLAWAPERFSVLGAEVHLYLPNGMARTKLPAHLERALGGDITFRNWRTVTTLVELAGA
jgi:uncharacterized protein (DUF1697 family)